MAVTAPPLAAAAAEAGPVAWGGVAAVDFGGVVYNASAGGEDPRAGPAVPVSPPSVAQVTQEVCVGIEGSSSSCSSQSGIGAGDVAAAAAVGAAIAFPGDGPALDIAALAAFGARAAKIAAALGIPLAITSDQAPRPAVYYHYTTNEYRDQIRESPFLMPSRDGILYLTTTVYPSGAQAQAQLGLSRTPQGYFVIPATLVPGVKGPFPVTSAAGQPGGGIEYRNPGPVPSAGLPWVGIGP